MNIEQITTTEIYLEGDSTTTVETLCIVEHVTIACDDDEAGEYTPMFAALLSRRIAA